MIASDYAMITAGTRLGKLLPNRSCRLFSTIVQNLYLEQYKHCNLRAICDLQTHGVELQVHLTATVLPMYVLQYIFSQGIHILEMHSIICISP